MAETVTAFLKCSECGAPFAPLKASQVTCGAVCGERHRTSMRAAQKRKERERARAGGPSPDARLRTPGELAATLARLTTRRELDEFHRDAALCWCVTEGAKAKTAIRALAIEARGRMQSL